MNGPTTDTTMKKDEFAAVDLGKQHLLLICGIYRESHFLAIDHIVSSWRDDTSHCKVRAVCLCICKDFWFLLIDILLSGLWAFSHILRKHEIESVTNYQCHSREVIARHFISIFFLYKSLSMGGRYGRWIRHNYINDNESFFLVFWQHNIQSMSLHSKRLAR